MTESIQHSHKSTLPVIFLMGATACGKTELSLSLAKQIDAEIISVDSALVYRGLNIGTAKPTTAEIADVAHHLIDVCDPWDSYSAARFCEDATRIILEVQARGKRVMLVGGTMLYFKALEEGLAELPEADDSIRGALMAEADEKGWPAMHALLATVDAEAAHRIHPNDPQRIQRAIEVYRITGIPMSQLFKETKSFLSQPPLKFALVPSDRAWLHERIARRFQLMLENGFLQEVEQLKSNTQIQADQPAMRSVGYRQAWDYLNLCSEKDQTSDMASDWVNKAVAATRQLAKRQLTWLRSMNNVNMISCDTLLVAEQLRTVCAVLKMQETELKRHS